MKLLLCALALLTMLVPATAQPDVPLPDPKAVTLDNGLVVTPLDVPTDHVARMLAIKMWRFKIATPKPGLDLIMRLELRKPGEEPTVFDTMIFEAPKQLEYTLGLMPIGSDNLWNAKKIRLYEDGRTIEPFDGKAGINSSSLGDRTNPWLNLQATGYSAYYPGTANKEGDIDLLRFTGGKPDAKLVMVVTVQNSTFK